MISALGAQKPGFVTSEEGSAKVSKVEAAVRQIDARSREGNGETE